MAALACVTLASCQPKNPPAGPGTHVAGPLVAVDLSDAREAPLEDAHLASARNETVGLGVRLTVPDKGRARKKLSLHVAPLKSAGNTIRPGQVTAYQVVAMPAATDRAEYVRHTGLPTSVARSPGALVPLEVDNAGLIQLAQLRDKGAIDRAGDKELGLAGPVTFWFDVRVPAETPPGEYATTIELVEQGWGQKVLASLPVRLTVDDFVLPDERHLLMVSRVEWDTLYRHWPAEFQGITPRLLNREEPRHAGAIRVMDQVARLAQANRVQVAFDRVQPTVKWPAGSPPRFDWTDFDTVVAPWLSGDAFADHVPYGYWPLPKADGLERYDRGSRMEYWQGAATHFDQKDWLSQASVLLDPSPPSPPSPATTEERREREVTSEAAGILRAHSRVRVSAPVPVDSLDVTTQRSVEGRVDAANAARLAAWGPGLVYAPPSREWPKGMEEPRRYLAVGQAGQTPYVGVGETERDVRQWAWLAFVQRAGMVLWGEPVPREGGADQPTGAAEQVWFYPGRWFGLDHPVETVQLKWARRAAQDYEYLWLARQRGEVVSPEMVARLLSKPVELRPGDPVDPIYSLVSATVDQRAWDEARGLVARAIGLARAGQRPDERAAEELRLATLRWTAAQGRPTVLARDVRWVPAAEGGVLDVRVGVDVYTAAEDESVEEGGGPRNRVEWAAVPEGWQVAVKAVPVPRLAVNQVRRVELDARFNVDRAGLATTGAGAVDFVSGYSGARSEAQLVLPVGVSERHEAIKLDGELADWNEMDAVQRGPLVRMLSQPSVRGDELPRAATESAVYTGWGEDGFYVGFKVGGVSGVEGGVRTVRNFIEYQQRRAWGEDLCEVLIQGLYGEAGEAVTGPVVHVVCKPSGQWVERRSVGDTEWSATGSGGVLYAGRIDAGTWRGELSVPWRLLEDARYGRPRRLRFNFAQHKSATGESASWAGPVDHGRDDGLMGLIVLRDKAGR